MPKTLTVRHCTKCGNELGIVNVRYASKKHTMKKLENMFYCEKCKKFLKLKEEFVEI